MVANLRKYVPQLDNWNEERLPPYQQNGGEKKLLQSVQLLHYTKGWRGLGHIEAECRTKARDQELNATAEKPKEVKKTDSKSRPRITEMAWIQKLMVARPYK